MEQENLALLVRDMAQHTMDDGQSALVWLAKTVWNKALEGDRNAIEMVWKLLNEAPPAAVEGQALVSPRFTEAAEKIYGLGTEVSEGSAGGRSPITEPSEGVSRAYTEEVQELLTQKKRFPPGETPITERHVRATRYAELQDEDKVTVLKKAATEGLTATQTRTGVYEL